MCLDVLYIVYYAVLELLYSKVGIFGLLPAVLYCTLVPCGVLAVVCHSSISIQ